jgi:hypothetical protein
MLTRACNVAAHFTCVNVRVLMEHGVELAQILFMSARRAGKIAK